VGVDLVVGDADGVIVGGECVLVALGVRVLVGSGVAVGATVAKIAVAVNSVGAFKATAVAVMLGWVSKVVGAVQPITRTANDTNSQW
jgi:hypothetical protein